MTVFLVVYLDRFLAGYDLFDKSAQFAQLAERSRNSGRTLPVMYFVINIEAGTVMRKSHEDRRDIKHHYKRADHGEKACEYLDKSFESDALTVSMSYDMRLMISRADGCQKTAPKVESLLITSLLIWNITFWLRRIMRTDRKYASTEEKI